MNKRQLKALNDPCFTCEQGTNWPVVAEESIDGLQISSALKVLNLFDNELWNAVVFVKDETGRQLKKSDLTARQNEEVEELLRSLLDRVGRDAISILNGDESDFEAVVFLNDIELKKMPKPNLFKLFDIKARQRFALANPLPGIHGTITGKFTKKLNFGGYPFSTILTIGDGEGGPAWHSSVSIVQPNGRPVKRKDMTMGAVEAMIHIAGKMVDGVGDGECYTDRSNVELDGVIFYVFKALSRAEARIVPPVVDFASTVIQMRKQAALN